MAVDLYDAERRWRSGDALEAGRILFEAISDDKKPSWAAQALEVARSQVTDHTSETDAVLSLVRDRARWREAHRQFQQIRQRTLKAEADGNRMGWPPKQLRLGYVLTIAELTAKVTYNATHPPDPFDEDSGWWIASCLRDLVNEVGDLAFEDRAWRSLLPPVG